ncbi:MAG: hypothetical protein JNJ73_14180 [Hyphomonadaceae bacterium]|nr:hypothetical protein [Hyphomonadaceae bacterium]
MSDTAILVDLPAGVLAAVERLARECGVSPSQFLASAAAEKVNAMLDPAAYLAARGANADLDWFDRFMARDGGEPPRPGDEAD